MILNVYMYNISIRFNSFLWGKTIDNKYYNMHITGIDDTWFVTFNIKKGSYN